MASLTYACFVPAKGLIRDLSANSSNIAFEVPLASKWWWQSQNLKNKKIGFLRSHSLPFSHFYHVLSWLRPFNSLTKYFLCVTVSLHLHPFVHGGLVTLTDWLGRSAWLAIRRSVSRYKLAYLAHQLLILEGKKRLLTMAARDNLQFSSCSSISILFYLWKHRYPVSDPLWGTALIPENEVDLLPGIRTSNLSTTLAKFKKMLSKPSSNDKYPQE